MIDEVPTDIKVHDTDGIRTIKALGGPDVAAMIWDRIEGKRAKA